jgi:hypothetical protein
MGQTLHFDLGPFTSGLPQQADIFRVCRHVSNVPTNGLAVKQAYIVSAVPRHASRKRIVCRICSEQASAVGRFAKLKTERAAERLPLIHHADHHDSTTPPDLYALVGRNQIGHEARILPTPQRQAAAIASLLSAASRFFAANVGCRYTTSSRTCI